MDETPTVMHGDITVQRVDRRAVGGEKDIAQLDCKITFAQSGNCLSVFEARGCFAGRLSLCGAARQGCEQHDSRQNFERGFHNRKF